MEDLANFIADGENPDGDLVYNQPNTTSRPKPGGLLKSQGQKRTPKKLVWAESTGTVRGHSCII